MPRSTPASPARAYALYSADTFAQDIGLDGAPIDPLLAFHVVFGKTVPDISLNAVANLGYADGRFLAPVFPGDTLRAVSEVIGVKENSNGKTGVVYIRTRGYNQEDDEVLNYVRWVMVNKKDHAKPAPAAVVPDLPKAVDPRELPQRAYDARGLQFRARRLALRLRGLRDRREDRPCRRLHRGRSRAPDRHAPLPEHRQGPLQPVRAAPDAARHAA